MQEHNQNHNHQHGECCAHEHDHQHGGICSCGHDHAHEEINKKDFFSKIGISGALLAAGYIMSELAERGVADIPSFVYLICFGIAYIVVGFSVIREAVESITHGDVFNENFLMAIASLGAFAVGEYTEGCAVMFLYTIGEFLQSVAVQRSRKSIKDMMELKPEAVTVLRDGNEQTVSPEAVHLGEIMLVKPGEKVNIDGEIVSGNAEVDMKALTGESIPVSKGAGDEVLAGAVVIDGALEVKAVREYKESTVAKILEMLEDAEEKKSHTEQFITRFSRIYTPIVCLIVLLIILIPPIFMGGDWHEWIYRGLSALVVSCPCALVISIPLGFFGGIGACSKEGILIKGGNYLEALTKADTAVFDKTGTITSGKFEYVSCECFDCHCSDNHHRELLKVIAACERFSNHPIAKSISFAFGHYAEECEIRDAKNYAGKGVSAVVDGVRYYVGNDKMMAQVGVDYRETALIGTAVYCCTDDKFLGDIVFADIIKTDSKEAVAELKRLGVSDTVMLTGDKEIIAKDIAEKAGIDTVYAKLLPADKVEKVKELQAQGKNVLYTGDGINDAPVLAQADLGVAMGAIGSDVAIEASDMVIMSDSISKIAVGRRIDRKSVV